MLHVDCCTFRVPGTSVPGTPYSGLVQGFVHRSARREKTIAARACAISSHHELLLLGRHGRSHVRQRHLLLRWLLLRRRRRLLRLRLLLRLLLLLIAALNPLPSCSRSSSSSSSSRSLSWDALSLLLLLLLLLL